MEKEKATMENMSQDAPNQVWRSFKDVFNRERKDDKFEGKMLNSMHTLGELEP